MAADLLAGRVQDQRLRIDLFTWSQAMQSLIPLIPSQFPHYH